MGLEESDFLQIVTGSEDGTARILGLLREEEHGLSISDISQKIGLNRNSVAKYLSVLVIAGKVEMRIVGSAKVYLISSRPSVIQLFDYIRESVIIIDSECAVRGINLACCGLLGLSKADAVGRDAAGISCPLLECLVASEVFFNAIRGTERIVKIRVDREANWWYQAVYIPVVLFNGQYGVAIILRDMSVDNCSS